MSTRRTARTSILCRAVLAICSLGSLPVAIKVATACAEARVYVVAYPCYAMVRPRNPPEALADILGVATHVP